MRGRGYIKVNWLDLKNKPSTWGGGERNLKLQKRFLRLSSHAHKQIGEKRVPPTQSSIPLRPEYLKNQEKTFEHYA
jgi:hypothetical protein